MRHSISLRSALISLCAAAIAAPASAFGIGLQPTTVEMEVEPGDRQRQVINIANVHTEKTISLTIGLADWSLDEDGQIELTPPGETDASGADWVRFSPAFVTLKPGEGEQIVVDMSTPTRLKRSGDFRFALIASTVLPEERAGQSGVWKKYQIASLFYMTTNPAESAPAIKDASLTVTPDGKQAVQVRIENDGNAHARLDGEITITGDNAEPQTIKIGNLVVLDESARVFSSPLAVELPANPKIEVQLENSFSPQSPGGIDVLAPLQSDLVIKHAALDPEDAPAPDASIED